MGMSVAEFEAQKSIGRFRILGVYDATALNVPGAYCYDEDLRYLLVEFVADKPVRIVGSDGGAPEDQSLVRDWQWVAVELNKLATELEPAVDANEASARYAMGVYRGEPAPTPAPSDDKLPLKCANCGHDAACHEPDGCWPEGGCDCPGWALPAATPGGSEPAFFRSIEPEVNPWPESPKPSTTPTEEPAPGSGEPEAPRGMWVTTNDSNFWNKPAAEYWTVETPISDGPELLEPSKPRTVEFSGRIVDLEAPKLCGVTSSLFNCSCDLEWGHAGDQHSSKGEDFYTGMFWTEHRGRQRSGVVHAEPPGSGSWSEDGFLPHVVTSEPEAPPPDGLCGIASERYGTCNLEWGHDGDLHRSEKNEFYTGLYWSEHRYRQWQRTTASEPTTTPTTREKP